MTNLQASLGLSQLKRIKNIIKIKKKIGNTYYQFLKNNNNIYIPSPINKNFENIYWVVGIVLDKNCKMDANTFAKKLLNKNIETRPFFFPMNKQKIFKKMKIFKKINMPVSEYISRNGFYLPSGLGLKNQEIDRVIKAILKIVS
jgi:perosamine synthetase